MNRNRRLLVLLLLCALFSACSDHPPSTPYRIGIINPNRSLAPVVEGFKKGMESFGYREGHEVVYLDDGPVDGMPAFDRAYHALEKSRVDLFLVCTQMGGSRMKILTARSGIPVLAAPILYPVQTGMVATIERPGGNITGIQAGGGISRILGLLKTIKPDMTNLYAPIAFQEPANALAMEELKKNARDFGVQVDATPVASILELENAMAHIPGKADAVWLFSSPFLVSNIGIIVDGATRARLPVASTAAQHDKGVLLSYSQDSRRTGEQASRMADKIIQGTRPADLPVETSELYLGINLGTAQAIELTIPETILRQADFIVR